MEPLQILHLEDDPLDTELIQTLIDEEGLAARVKRVDTLAAYLEELDRHCYPLVLSDYTVPGVDPMEVLRLTRNHCPEAAFLFVSGTMGEERAIEALKLGANDYVLKQRMDRMVPAIRRALREVEEQHRRKRAEEDLRRLNQTLETQVEQRTRELRDANASLQMFADTAAHDLRRPLRAIRSFAALTAQQCGPQLDEEGKVFLSRIIHSAEHMGRLLDDLLNYSRMSQAELKLERVSLARLTHEAVALLDAEIKTRSARVAVGELPDVIGHPATVMLLISNLLSNALKFVAPGVTPVVSINATTREKYVRVCVQDNGIGVAPQDMGKLFAVFRRLHSNEAYPGTGLGLAIVKKGAERMGGSVGLESKPGHGSSFWFELPKA